VPWIRDDNLLRDRFTSHFQFDVRRSVREAHFEEFQMPSLNIEHVACNVSDPVAVAAWYVEHLGMRIVRRVETAPHIHFLADEAGRAVIEIYSNAADPVPDYRSMHPLRFHVAFAAEDPDGAMAALLSAGATFFSDQVQPDGSRLVMLRDPWGLPLQLCKRPVPLVQRS
jgi:glyoxylase I family protein